MKGKTTRFTLAMQPTVSPMSWEEFCKTAPSFSIALDGYVAAGPHFNEEGPHLNLNHHEEVDRLATRATCGQVLITIRQGLFNRFRDSNGPCAIVFTNDCDEDVCASWFLLENFTLCEPVMNPIVNRFVYMVDMLDTTAGAYPYPPDMQAIRELEWVFQPYRLFRNNGGIDRRDPTEFTSIVDDVGNRIMRHITGRGIAVALDTRYETIGGGKNWAMIKEIGLQGRTGAFADGIHAYVVVRQRKDGKFAYTVGRMSPFIPFPVPEILTALNEAEGINSTNHWGGGNTIGGSDLTPSEVEKVVNQVLQRGE